MSQVDPSDLGRGPKREIFHLKKETGHTETAMIKELEQTKEKKPDGTLQKEAEAIELAQARDVAGRIIKSDNSVDWLKTPGPGPWSGRIVEEDKKTEDVLIGFFPRNRPVVRLSLAQKLLALLKRK